MKVVKGIVISLVFYVKDHHLYPIQDDHLKHKANQAGADNLWKYMTDMKWSNKSSNYIMYQDLVMRLLPKRTNQHCLQSRIM